MSILEKGIDRRTFIRFSFGLGVGIGLNWVGLDLRQLGNGVRRIDVVRGDDVEWGQVRVARVEELLHTYGSPMAGIGMGKYLLSCEQKHRIKLEVPWAIAGADSSFGRKLSKAGNFNPGNVANTDSCPTCMSFGSWEEGMEAIFKVLNQANFSHKHTMRELSCGGYYMTGSSQCLRDVYASSDRNWHVNVTTFLKEFFSADDRTEFDYYNFREL